MKRALLLILLLFPVLIKAQSNFQEGYVVTLPGDTLKGFIDFREWNQTPESFTYKATLDAKDTKSFTPESARYVSIANLEAYQFYKGPVSQGKVVLPGISVGVDTTTLNKTVFLKVLQAGPKVWLYAYRDHIKTRFYLRHHDEQVAKELIYRVYYKVQDAKEQGVKPEFTMKSKLYIGQLWLAASKYQAGTPALKRQLDLLNYSEPDLLKVAASINGLTQQKDRQLKASGPGAVFFAGGGVNRTMVEITGSNVLTAHYSWDAESSMEKRTYLNRQQVGHTPKLNAGIDLAPFPNTQKFLLRGELTLTTTRMQFLNPQTVKNPDREMLYTFTFNQVIATVAPQLIYNLYNGNRFKGYLGVGAAYSYCLSSENRLDLTILTPGTSKSYETASDNYLDLTRNWVNFPLRAGVLINKTLDLSVIYWTPTPLTQSASRSKVNSLHIGLNYVWNKQ